MVADLPQQHQAFVNPAAVVQGYIDGVLDGSIVCGRLIRLAVERHLRDLKTQNVKGFYFDEAAAAKPIRFCKFVRHSTGEWGPKNGQPGQVFVPEPWQCFILWVMFGWKLTKNDTRRFRVSYIEVARKNGKSFLAALIGLYLFYADGEPGSQVYTAATKRDQARIVHGEAIRMVKASPVLKSRIKIVRDNMSDEKSGSKFEPLGEDSDTEDGLNPHGAVIDELHAHKTRAMWDVIDTATGARSQPMLLAITTAGNDEETICFEQHEHGIKVLEGADKYIDDSFFCYIAALDTEDDWCDPAVWPKANPNWGVSIKTDDFAVKAQQAQQLAGARNQFKQKRLNIWVQNSVAWLNVDQWDACERPYDAAFWDDAERFSGMDLATKLDITAYIELLVKQGRYRIQPYFWIPQETAAQREREDRIPYAKWIERGAVLTTPGGWTDYDKVEERIGELTAVRMPKGLAFDPANSGQIVQHLMEKYGIKAEQFIQSFPRFNETSREFEKLIASGMIEHDGNEVLRWMVGNVSLAISADGSMIRPKKPGDKSNKKIDGVVASIMALSMSMYAPPTDTFDFRIV